MRVLRQACEESRREIAILQWRRLGPTVRSLLVAEPGRPPAGLPCQGSALGEEEGAPFQASWSRGEEKEPTPLTGPMHLETERWDTVLDRLASELASKEQS